ncbi:MAG TPA: TMEM175 family protein [Puia sp.]|nr:TMEM175 family protein [Puia sp.]
MNKARLEAFSDGVFAIIITIMVLEIKVPHGEDWDALKPLLPQFLSYVLSFSFVGIYWVNHHHLVHTINRVNTPILWSNIFLLFWLSLIPVATDWMGESHFAPHPVAVYALLLLLCGIAYSIFGLHLEKKAKNPEKFEKAFSGLKKKSIISLILYTVALIFAFINTRVSGILFLVVAITWFIPDKNIEQVLGEE